MYTIFHSRLVQILNRTIIEEFWSTVLTKFCTLYNSSKSPGENPPTNIFPAQKYNHTIGSVGTSIESVYALFKTNFRF